MRSIMHQTRTTLALDGDVLACARGLAAQQRRTVGEVISDLARQSLQRAAAQGGQRNGLPLLPVREGVLPVTPDMVGELRDDPA